MEITPPQIWRLNAQRLKMEGSNCPNCEQAHFPPRRVCPDCGEAVSNPNSALEQEGNNRLSMGKERGF